jgi:hypothetical protein
VDEDSDETTGVMHGDLLLRLTESIRVEESADASPPSEREQILEMVAEEATPDEELPARPTPTPPAPPKRSDGAIFGAMFVGAVTIAALAGLQAMAPIITYVRAHQAPPTAPAVGEARASAPIVAPAALIATPLAAIAPPAAAPAPPAAAPAPPAAAPAPPAAAHHHRHHTHHHDSSR